MTLRAGIVGAGKQGFHYAHRLSMLDNVQIAGIADPNRPVRDSFAKSFGVRLAVSDHRRLTSDPQIDLICITSPPATHSAIIIDALEGNKHVICEPPVAINIDQAEEIIQAVKKSDRRFFVALSQRYDPINQEIARLIEEDEIGYPFLTLASSIENDYDRLNDWHDWKGTWEMGGGGVLMQQGSDILDLLIHLLGPVDAVSAVCTRFAITPLNKAEDSCLLGLEFLEEATAELALTGAAKYIAYPNNHTGNLFRLEVYGLEGSIRISNVEPRLIISTKKSPQRIVDETAIKTNLPTDMFHDFIDCILNDKDPLVTPEDAVNALRVILAAYKASQMKRRVETLEQL